MPLHPNPRPDPNRLIGLDLSPLAQRLLPGEAPGQPMVRPLCRHVRRGGDQQQLLSPPAPSTFAGWRDRTPPGFRYAVKASRFLTQAKKLKDCEEPLARMLALVRELGAALGPILYQLPPRFRLNFNRLESFLQLLPDDLCHVFEFRDASWCDEKVLELLDRYDASFCAHDMPGLATPRWAVGRIAYVRFHGGVGKYWGRYPDEVLAGWADWMADQAKSGRAVRAFFNNDIDAHAIHDALTLEAMLRQMMRS